MRLNLVCGVALLAVATPAIAETGTDNGAAQPAATPANEPVSADPDEIIITGARSILPATALRGAVGAELSLGRPEATIR